jgi:hypothetical protein
MISSASAAIRTAFFILKKKRELLQCEQIDYSYYSQKSQVKVFKVRGRNVKQLASMNIPPRIEEGD